MNRRQARVLEAAHLSGPLPTDELLAVCRSLGVADARMEDGRVVAQSTEPGAGPLVLACRLDVERLVRAREAAFDAAWDEIERQFPTETALFANALVNLALSAEARRAEGLAS